MSSGQDTFLQIVRSQADYARVLDNDQLEQWPDFFIDDCNYKITTANNHARGYEAAVVFANSRGMLTDRVSALREANIFEKQNYRHIMGMPVILSDDDKGIRCETSFLVVRIMQDGVTDVFAAGRYLDLYRRVGEELKISERAVVCDSSRFDTLLAIPL